MHLVIVESPTKARKLAGYLGSEYKVEASVGHVRDLPKKSLGVDVDHDFAMSFEIDPGKKDVLSKLSQLAAKADQIYLATDPDREGEAIAWHIQQILTGAAATSAKSKSKASKSEKIDLSRFHRATFHEITKSAVLNALKESHDLDTNLVYAQQARRVVDRLVGYQVSPVLWKKVRRGLSAGRVQSVALRLIVEREREIIAFKPEEYWELDVALNTILGEQLTGPFFVENNPKEDLPTSVLIGRVIKLNGKEYAPSAAEHVEPVLQWLPAARYTVTSVTKKERQRVSLPPFTTSTLQQAAANRLGFTSKQTMALAQQLYEEGLITYHRTDAVALSQDSVAMARDFIGQEFGADYVPAQPRFFANKSKNAQEAHEAIRVTDVKLSSDGVVSNFSHLSDRHAKLYDLIWRRFVASQMAAARSDLTTLLISAKAETGEAELRTSGSIMIFDGWTKLFPAGDDVLLPAVNEGQNLDYLEHQALQKFTQPPARFNDAGLVKELEKRGIGRPSTYASIISVIVDRGYVERGSDKRFFPTSIGGVVTDFLIKYFNSFMDYGFTAQMEDNLDEISRGEKDWVKVVKTFYEPLAKTIDSVVEKAERMAVPVEKTGEKCPTCGDTEGGEIVIRTGRFGKFKSCSRFPACEYTENMQEKLPDMKCPLCQQGEVIVKQTRWKKSFFGCSRYPECSWASWQKPQPGMIVTPEEWAEQQAARKARADAKAASGKPSRYGNKSAAKPSSKTSTKTKSAAKKTTKAKTTTRSAKSRTSQA